MDFRVLGPFETHSATGPVELRGTKRRGLLALFVVNRGRLCRMDEIVDALWNGQPAAGAVGTVQTYVSQLRKVLDADATIATRPGGYVFDASPASVDAEVFDQLLDDAAREREATARHELLQRALMLYRGRPLDEFAGAPWADEPARRWERLHVVALEQLCDVLLELDRGLDAQALLERAVAAHPLHERFWVQLATARYRAGDQSLALAACRDARYAVAEALGVEPGPEMQELERRILDHDPSLWAHPRVAQPRLGEAIPTGIVTFVMTDIARSSRLWENDPRSMAAALARHDEIIGKAVDACGGRVFKHSGDGLLAAFSAPSAAIAAALQAQRALLRESWPTTEPIRARMAVHIGEAVIERDGDYFGPVVNRCARVLTLARGGQILLSGIVASALRDHPVTGVVVEYLGEYRLRDLAEAERVAQVVHDALPHYSPPEHPIHATGNLPVDVTTFIGRDEERERLVATLRQHPLTTIVGPAGIGKTRLAIRAASDLLDEFPGGVWFVDLSSVSDGALVAGEIASVLDIGVGPNHDVIGAIGTRLNDRETLLVLDNCEQLIDAVAGVASAVLRRVAHLRLIATSRQPLEVAGEIVFRVGPLPVEDEVDSPGSAVRLFVERAKAVSPGFVLDDSNADAVRELCRRLDGVPLALELAAARVRSMHPADLVARLDHRFDLLRGPRAGDNARHHTLRSAIDWSYSLLADCERALFMSLSVFRGSFGISSVEAIGTDLEADAVEILDRLVSRSFVVLESAEAPSRYRLLDTLRAYAAEQLAATGGARTIEERHARLFLATPDLDSADVENVRAALQWQIESEPEDAARTVLALWGRHFPARLVELQHWLELVLARIGDGDEPGGDEALTARVLERLGDACFQTGIHTDDGVGWLERALAIRERLGDTTRAARVRVQLARNLSGYPSVMDIDQAMTHASIAEATLRDAGDARHLAEAYLMKSSIALYGRRNRDGIRAARAAIELAEQAGLEIVRRHALAQYGAHLGYCGDTPAGFDLLEQVWETGESSGDYFAQFLAAWMRGFGALLLWDPADALLWWGRERSRAEDEEAPLQARTLDSMIALAHLKTGDARAARAIAPHDVLNAPQLIPFAAVVSGDWNRAVSLLTVRAAEARQRRNRNEWTQLALGLAQLKARLGERDAARVVARDLLDSLTDEPSPYYELPVRSLLLQLGDEDGRHLDRCDEVMQGRDYRGLAGAVAFAAANARERSGDHAGADEAFSDACEIFERYSLHLDQAEALASWARMLASSGERAQSDERVHRCEQLLDQINAPSWRRVFLGGES